MALGIYSPTDVLIIVGGVLKISGYVEGTFLEIKKDLSTHVSRRTPDGTTARLYIKDRTYTIRFTLAQFSESNDVLTKIQQFDEITQLGYFPLLIKDVKGTSFIFAPTAWIQSTPDQTFGTGIEARTWELKAVDVTNHVGGNSEADNLFDDLVKTILSTAPQLGDLIGDIN